MPAPTPDRPFRALPEHFDCIEISTPGAPEVMRSARRPMLTPVAGQVLIQVHAAGVNRPDVLQRLGKYPLPPGVTDLPGLEVAGVIASVAPDVARWKVGDRVCALTNGGGYASYCVAPAGSVVPIPTGLTMIEAAALPETFFTVWSNVFDRGQLKPGETFMVQGGSSGIGTAAIQIAAARGHTVFATAGSAEKCAACEKLGATRAINYRTEDFEAVVRAATGGRGVDVILDMVGGDYVPKELKLLAESGRLVFIAFLGGMKATVDLNELMRRRLTMTGSTLRPRDDAFKAQIAAALEREVWPLVNAGRIKPVIHATFPLAQAADAHTLMESGAHIGKIVLEVV
ncbi:MAG: NAD(P)H-quinone oxidoreductase [Proteobacteria bacterium]|nr:NAD(P)H-quinone oxidoreductase [Burkholderiales bacterium]